MKRFSILFLAIATVAMASAQTKIEKLFNEIDSLPVKELLSKSHYEDDADNPSTYCLFSEVKMRKSDFREKGVWIALPKQYSKKKKSVF